MQAHDQLRAEFIEFRQSGVGSRVTCLQPLTRRDGRAGFIYDMVWRFSRFGPRLAAVVAMDARMTFKTAFDGGHAGYTTWWFPAWGLIFGCVGAVITFRSTLVLQVMPVRGGFAGFSGADSFLAETLFGDTVDSPAVRDARRRYCGPLRSSSPAFGAIRSLTRRIVGADQ
jgi:hypothetical protein